MMGPTWSARAFRAFPVTNTHAVCIGSRNQNWFGPDRLREEGAAPSSLSPDEGIAHRENPRNPTPKILAPPIRDAASVQVLCRRLSRSQANRANGRSQNRPSSLVVGLLRLKLRQNYASISAHHLDYRRSPCFLQRSSQAATIPQRTLVWCHLPRQHRSR